MMTSDDVYARLERHFADWAAAQSVIQAVIVVGSRARLDHPADDWSDLDLVVFTSEATSYLSDSTWLNTFGPVVAAIDNSFGQHDREWIALYENGSKLDVAFLSIEPMATPVLQSLLDVFPYPVVLRRGVRVLIDKTSVSTPLRLPDTSVSQLPDQAEFTALIHRMWLDAIKAAKFIRRRDLWQAKQLCDAVMKQHLLTMLEWQALAQSDWRDVWYNGRFMNEWADAKALEELPATFALYEAADLQRALSATLNLFRLLAQDVARQLGYSFPAKAEEFIDNTIDSIV